MVHAIMAILNISVRETFGRFGFIQKFYFIKDKPALTTIVHYRV